MIEEKIGYVYLTTNLLNGKQYIGQHLHNGFDTKYKGSGTYITNAINKYGWDNFKCEVLQWCTTQTQLNEVEDNCIRLYGTLFPNGYNLKGGGANGKYSKESCNKMSKTRKGKKLSEQHCKSISESHVGHTVSEETRKKISEAHKGRTPSEETRKKMSEAQKIRKRKPLSEETKQKISEANKGRKLTDEQYKKLCDSHKGKTQSEETIKKRVEKLKGHKVSKEARERISKARTGIKLSKETREKISKINKGRKLSKETREKMSKSKKGKLHWNSKSVLQIDVNTGNVIKHWDFLKQIENQLGFDHRNISACCRGRYKTAYGYVWKYNS